MVWHKSLQHSGIQSLLCYFPLRWPRAGHCRDPFGTKWDIVCAWACSSHPQSCFWLRGRQVGREGAQTFVSPSCHSGSWGVRSSVTCFGRSRGPAAGQGENIRPFLFQPGFSSPHVCPVPRTAVWIPQKGYQQTSPNRIPQNSWDLWIYVLVRC